MALLSSPLFGLPHGAIPISGETEIHLTSPEALDILASDRSMIEWSDFSIESGETVRFIQPHSSASVLNRVMEAYPSRLMGNLEANGQVLLINPNGILVGKEAVINAGSWIASTLDLQDEVFLSGKEWKFEGESLASIENYGNITSGGDLYLAAHSIVNEGSLKGQEVGLIACSELGIKMKGSDRLFFRTGDSVIHTGSIVASKEESGGNAYLLGEQVILTESATVDASHSFGGGQILIGGDYLGENDSIPNAKYLYVAPQAKINVSAVHSGDGGRAILWGKEGNHTYGTILALGGKEKGNGGFVEISGEFLDFQGEVSTLAANGNTGTLLLDPLDITISTLANNAVSAGPNFVPTGGACDGLAGHSNVTPATLVAALVGNNVTVSTLGTVGPCPGDITVTNVVSWASAHSLTLSSAGNITINASIQNNGAVGAAGNVILIAPTGKTISILTIADLTNVYVGSQNGRTSIGDLNLLFCNRSRADVFLNSDFNSDCHLGFNIPLNGIATGPIEVVCHHLDIFSTAGTVGGVNSSVAIGHGGRVPGFVPPGPMNTANTATIRVDASDPSTPTTIPPGNAIHLRTSLGINRVTSAAIGHGGVFSANDLEGDICVAAVGDIVLDFNGNPASPESVRIGHGTAQNSNFVTTAGGNITVTSSRGSIHLSSVNTVSTGIGHQSVTGNTSMTGDIFVSALNDITITSSGIGTLGQVCGIGHNAPNIQTMTGSIFVSAGRDLTITGANSVQDGGFLGIGSRADIVNGSVAVYVGRNISMTNSINASPTNIGYSVTAPPGNSNTYVAAGGTITMTEFAQIRGPGNVNVAALGSITGSGFATFLSSSFISTINNATTATTRIFSGGTIQSVNTIVGPSTFNFLLGQTTLAAWEGNIDIEAGAAVIIPYVVTTDAGNVTIKTTHTFAASDLWTTNGLQLTTVCGQAVVPLPAYSVCGNCVNPFAQANSLANAPVDGANNYQVTGVHTMSGSILIQGGICPTVANFNTGTITSVTGTISISNYNDITVNLPLTTGSNSVPAISLNACHDVIIPTGSSVIDTGAGSILLTAGNNISVNGALPAIAVSTLSGPITLSANNDVNVNRTITSTAGGAISVTSDADLSGAGNINIAGIVTTTSGNILFQAGDSKGCFALMHNSSFSQTAGLISTVSGNVDINADLDITFSGTGPASVQLVNAGTGYFHTIARRDTNLTNAILTKTGAGTTGSTDFLMISGRNMTLKNSHIVAMNSFVTLVVDNCFPASPLIGPGAFNLDAASTIDPINLRIFTALRPQNTISGTLNGVPFVPGTLFVDTATEHWCQYFAFPFAYPFSNLGVPYTVFYKNCLGPAVNQAQIIVMQFLIDLHPFNEFPGWLEEFYLKFRGCAGTTIASSMNMLTDEPYYIRRRELKLFNLPKYYTIITNDSYLERSEMDSLEIVP